MSPDLNDAMLDVYNEAGDWAYDIIKFELDRRHTEITQLREQLAKARDIMDAFYRLLDAH